MNVFDYCTVLDDREDDKILEFRGTAHLIEDSEGYAEYWVQGVDGENERELMEYVKTLDDGVYNIHTYKSMVTNWCEEEGLMWDEYDSTGTMCEEVEVKKGTVIYL